MMVIIKRSAALLMAITNNKNKIRIIKTCPAGLRKSLWIVPQRHSGVDVPVGKMSIGDSLFQTLGLYTRVCAYAC